MKGQQKQSIDVKTILQNTARKVLHIKDKYTLAK